MHKYLLVLLLIIVSCSSQNKTTQQANSMTEPFIIYKTKADYSNNVPVILNSDKTTIVSYPAPSDLILNGGFQLPIKLSDGYLIDNRGINQNVAFTSYTYAEYCALTSAPEPDEIVNKIIDRDPLLELIDCKRKISIKLDRDKVNRLVEKNFKGCVRLK